MRKIAIYGAGGFGREVACLINIINEKTPQWELVGFFDDGVEKESKNEYGAVLGGINELNSYPENISIVIAIAIPKIKEKIYNSITNSKVDFPNIISPDLIYLDENNVSTGIGNIITAGCLLSCNVIIGDFNIINWFVTIGHDTKIENFNSFMPSVSISGNVNIGNSNYFGANSVVLQKINVTNEIVVGANSLILKNTRDGMTYIGNPARIVKT